MTRTSACELEKWKAWNLHEPAQWKFSWKHRRKKKKNKVGEGERRGRVLEEEQQPWERTERERKRREMKGLAMEEGGGDGGQALVCRRAVTHCHWKTLKRKCTQRCVGMWSVAVVGVSEATVVVIKPRRMLKVRTLTRGRVRTPTPYFR